jgi:type I restriction enzyme S subunit
VRGPGVVTGRSGSIGNVFFVEKDFWPLNTVLYVKDFHGNDPRFVYHLLRKFDLSRFASGTGVPTLNRNFVHDEPVNVPPLPEQRRIVGILDEAFAGIATAKANAEKNLQNARDLFESSLQALFRQRGMGWTDTTLQAVADRTCSLSYGIVQPGEEWPGGLPVVRPTDLTTTIIGLDGLKRVNPTVAEAYKRTALQGNESLLCVRGSTGVVAMASPELKGANVTRGIVPVRFDNSRVSPPLGYYLLRSTQVQDQIRKKTYGAALMQINIGELRQIVIAVPPRQEQDAMVSRLDRLAAETERLELLYASRVHAVNELRTSLLHHAFTGQL